MTETDRIKKLKSVVIKQLEVEQKIYRKRVAGALKYKNYAVAAKYQDIDFGLEQAIHLILSYEEK